MGRELSHAGHTPHPSPLPQGARENRKTLAVIVGSVDILKFIPSFRRKPESIGRKVNNSKTSLTNSVIGFPPRIKYGVTFFRGNDWKCQQNLDWLCYLLAFYGQA